MHSSIDALPLDTLVQILCRMNHDELEPLLSVSKSFRSATCIAQQMHFDFATPAPKKMPVLNGGMDCTPIAPSFKMGCRKPRKCLLSQEETRRIAVTLFPVRDWEKEPICSRNGGTLA